MMNILDRNLYVESIKDTQYQPTLETTMTSNVDKAFPELLSISREMQSPAININTWREHATRALALINVLLGNKPSSSAALAVQELNRLVDKQPGRKTKSQLAALTLQAAVQLEIKRQGNTWEPRYSAISNSDSAFLEAEVKALGIVDSKP